MEKEVDLHCLTCPAGLSLGLVFRDGSWAEPGTVLHNLIGPFPLLDFIPGSVSR